MIDTTKVMTLRALVKFAKMMGPGAMDRPLAIAEVRVAPGPVEPVLCKGIATRDGYLLLTGPQG